MSSCVSNKKLTTPVVSTIGLRGKRGPAGPQGPAGVGTPLFSVTFVNTFTIVPCTCETLINPDPWILTNPNFIISSFDINTGLFTVPADGYYLFNSTVPYTVDEHTNLNPSLSSPILGFKKTPVSDPFIVSSELTRASINFTLPLPPPLTITIDRLANTDSISLNGSFFLRQNEQYGLYYFNPGQPVTVNFIEGFNWSVTKL